MIVTWFHKGSALRPFKQVALLICNVHALTERILFIFEYYLTHLKWSARPCCMCSVCVPVKKSKIGQWLFF